MLTVGDKFPQFKLNASVSREKGKEFKTVSNADYAGKWIVFYAYPKDFTFICPTEIVEFGKHTKDFADRDAVVIGGSTDNEYSHLAWRNAHADLADLPTPLVHIKPDFAQELGIIHKGAGAALRVTFVVDPDGIIRSVSAYDLSVGRNVGEVLRTLDALQTDELCPCNWQKGEDVIKVA
ncbi:MAG: alkyl hydroperoxide reductase [Acidobacteria bacterium]|jgi:alkyl hydroperoxide reductase subunit AhpC|nr:MAG: alkyl hydroperoxide reductase [Acidobacteriota bacterium]